MNDRQRMCAKCGEAPAGPGGVLCPGCNAALREASENYWSTAPDAAAAGTD